MYAVIRSGGKQYRVEEGQQLRLEKLAAEPGATLDLDQVLLVANDDAIQVGQPLVAGAHVKAEVVSHGRGKKIKIIKFKRRKHHMKQMGHRQDFTLVKIVAIDAGGK